ncbi:MAG: hypothetical protein EA406_11340 [Rhodospirillales bacterium]|nr:MAG: hypothetical protein EA406_11340 [Rhodospirillales bacterium]
MAAAAIIALSGPAPAGATDGGDDACRGAMIDPIALYGEELRFRVLREGSPVGVHRVRFQRQGDRVIADTRFDLEVRVLFFTAYRFQYQSRDVWQDGCLVSLTAKTDDNGAVSAVAAERRNGRLHVEGPGGRFTTEPGIFPTTHWNAEVVGSDRVLNTINGRIAEVDIRPMGRSRVTLSGTSADARHYRYTGDLQTEVWYDSDGRWVKMRFQAKDGSTIEYQCESCRPGPTGSPEAA